MKRIFIDKISGESHILSGDVHKHLSVVLRAKTGEKLELCCGDGFVYSAEILSITKNETVLQIISAKKDTSEPNIICDLFMGIIKGDHLEIALQKAVELGVNSVRPIVTAHTVKTDLNLIRMNKIAAEAAAQCGRGRVPHVYPPVKIDTVYEELADYDCVVFPYENAQEPDIKMFLSEKSALRPALKPAEKSALKSALKSAAGGIKMAVVIGPEGGFSKLESEKLSQITTPVTLGERILRSDTACIATLSAVMYAFDELKR